MRLGASVAQHAIASTARGSYKKNPSTKHYIGKNTMNSLVFWRLTPCKSPALRISTIHFWSGLTSRIVPCLFFCTRKAKSEKRTEVHDFSQDDFGHWKVCAAPSRSGHGDWVPLFSVLFSFLRVQFFFSPCFSFSLRFVCSPPLSLFFACDVMFLLGILAVIVS